VRGWLVGPLTATLALVGLRFVALGLYTSPAGLLVAGIVAFLVGTRTAAVFDRSRRRHAAVVAAYIFVVLAAYLLILQLMAEPGSKGGPAVLPPP
jgi:hypothetical protein